ncbi:MAG: helix-turn-helix transcriptional regulator [Pseudomonadota bacterium]
MAKDRVATKNAAGNLGPYLRKARDDKGYSLRQVEAQTGGEVSNAYLSQLEGNKIAKPSPNILYALSKALDVEYDELMLRAGYISELASNKQPKNKSKGKRQYAIENLTAAEESELLRYLKYYRSTQE